MEGQGNTTSLQPSLCPQELCFPAPISRGRWHLSRVRLGSPSSRNRPRPEIAGHGSATARVSLPSGLPGAALPPCSLRTLRAPPAPLRSGARLAAAAAAPRELPLPAPLPLPLLPRPLRGHPRCEAGPWRRAARRHLPVDRILVPFQGVVDSGAHAGRHDIGVRGVGAVVLSGVERRPMVEVVHRGDRSGGVGVPVHGRRHPYSVHPAVVGQLIVLSKSGPEEKKEKERGEERGE